jgi:hypothetical protein
MPRVACRLDLHLSDSFRELSIALCFIHRVTGRGGENLGLWDNGHVGELAAFSLVIAIGTVIVGSIFLRLAQRYGLQD